MKKEHENFLFELAGTDTGTRLSSVMSALVQELYSSKGKGMESVQLDQRVAAFLEKEIIARLDQREPEQLGSDYR